MAIAFFEGWERYVDVADFLDSDYIEGTTSPASEFTLNSGGVGSSKYLSLLARSTDVLGINVNTRGLIGDMSGDDIIVGCHLLLDTVFNGSKNIRFGIAGPSTDMWVDLIRNGTGASQILEVRDRAGGIHTHDTALPLNTWMHVQIFLNRTAGRVEFFFNGTQIYTSVNSITTQFVVEFTKTDNAFAGESVGSIDNFYVSTGSVNPGELTGDILSPTSDV